MQIFVKITLFPISTPYIIELSINLRKGVTFIMGIIDSIKAKAKADKKTIVLPESMDRRTWVAAEKIL